MLTPEMAAVRRRLRDDFAFYAEHALKIRTKDGEIKPLVFNAAQRYFLERIEDQLEEQGFIRAVILKGRQQGLSTVVGARLVFKTTQAEALKALVVAHKSDSTRALFDMTRRYYNHLPEILKPVKEYSSRSELVFEKLQSSYTVATAGGDGIARGETLQLVHLSEVAFWSKTTAADNFNGLMKAVPGGTKAAGSEVYVESTANGVTGVFAELWRGAVDGTNGFIPIFIPWFWQDEYRLPVPPGFERTPDEQDLAALHGLDDEQLVWRRNEIATNGVELFQQEYPCTPDEAFLTSGRPVFDQKQLADLLLQSPSASVRMGLDLHGTSFEPDPRGELLVYREPVLTDTYSIGADVAEGIAGRRRSNGEAEGDYSVAQVLDGEKRQAAVWRGHCHPDHFAKVLYALGRMYSDALIACESNNHGLLPNIRLSKDMNYPNVYTTVVVDKTSDRETVKLGFQTNVASKPLIIDELRAAMRLGEIEVVDRKTLEEMRSYIITENGKLEAEPGVHDDTVMALAIANHVHQGRWTPVEVPDDLYVEMI